MPNHKEANILFAQRLNEAMRIRDVSAAELSRRTGIDEGAISHYKKGSCMPKSKRVFDISKALGVNPTWLLGFSDEMLYEMPEIDAARNELENLIADMSLEQVKKTIQFVRDYIL